MTVGLFTRGAQATNSGVYSLFSGVGFLSSDALITFASVNFDKLKSRNF
jgi:hypothetical protein